MTVEASVIVPTYNSEKKISECLNALMAQKTKRRYEIIVVNDGSADHTADVVKRYEGVRLINQENSGPSVARNRGVREAAGDFVLFIDDDCIAEPDWLEKMLTAFKDPEVVGAKGAYLTRQKELIAKFVQVEYEEKYDELLKYRYIDFVDTYSAVFKRWVILEAGGYDERFTTPSAEDQELSFRLANAGYKMVFVPDARVWHRHIDTVRGYLGKKMKNGYWKVFVLLRNPNKAAGDSHTPTTQKIQLLLTGAFIPSFGFLALGSWGVSVPAGLTILFLITTLPLSIKCLYRGTGVGLLAPVFIACRSVGLTAGLVKGFWHWCVKGAYRKSPANNNEQKTGSR